MFVLRYLNDLLVCRRLVDGLGSSEGEGLGVSLGEGLGVSFWPPLENLSPLDFPLELENLPPLDLSEENLLLEVDDISSSSLLCNSLLIFDLSAQKGRQQTERI